MSHLTRVFLDYETAALRGVHDAYDWHQRAWDAFPHLDGARNDRRCHGEMRHFLTRLDDKDGGYQLLILSPTEPCRPGWCPDYEGNWQAKPVANSFLEHARYRFSLRVNPTKKLTPKGADGKRHGQGKRVAVRDFAELASWMERKAADAGFAIEPGSLRIAERGLYHFTQEKERRLGTLNIVDFDGALRVTDQVALKAAFQNGIGSAKAFGCGLLVLQPLD
jgi:CRISPR system Cascade subunit CasE